MAEPIGQALERGFKRDTSRRRGVEIVAEIVSVRWHSPAKELIDDRRKAHFLKSVCVLEPRRRAIGVSIVTDD